MKNILTLILFFSTNIFATNYYITPSGSGNGLGLDSSNTMSYANLFNKALNSNDVVNFKAGNVYVGQHYAKDGVTYQRYSSGANPIISGFTVLNTWSLLSGNIYYASLNVPILHGVTVDGVVKGMGRYPNTGYLSYESSTGNTSITDNQLSGSPSWVGAEVVIRKFRWVLDRHFVTGHSGGTLTYSSTNFYGDNNSYEPVPGNGYFIQGHLNTLDQDGEWFYDRGTQRLYMYFASGTSSGHTVKVSALDQVVPLNGATNITFSNIDFEGGNTAIVNNGSTGITINNCNFRQQGSNAIYGINCNSLTVTGGSITDALNNSIYVVGGGNNTNIDGVNISKSGIVAGMGASAENSYTGMYIVGDNTTIKNCTVTDAGWNGIEFMGNNVLVTQNFVNRFGLVKDDCGGVYTYNGDNGPISNRVVKKNIILNAIGAQDGTDGDPNGEKFGKACGVYLDDFSNDVQCDSNTINVSPWAGVLVHNSINVTVRGNTVFNTANALLILQGNTPERNLIVTGNQFIAKEAWQRTMSILTTFADDPSLFGTFNNNYYARPIDDNLTIIVDKSYTGGTGPVAMSLATWKSTFSQDANSNKSLVPVTNVNDFRFDYNYSNAVAKLTFPSIYKGINNAIFSGSLSLQPYTGAVSIYGGIFSGAPGFITIPSAPFKFSKL